jgi:hypothetical protein
MVLSPFLSGKVIYFDENGFGNGSIWCKLGMKPGHVNTATKEKTEQKKQVLYVLPLEFTGTTYFSGGRIFASLEPLQRLHWHDQACAVV